MATTTTDTNSSGDDGGGDSHDDDDIVRVVIVCTLFVLVSIAMVIYIFNKFCKCFFYAKRNASGSARRWFFFGLKDSKTPQSDTSSPASNNTGSMMANPECAQIVIDDPSPSREPTTTAAAEQSAPTEHTRLLDHAGGRMMRRSAIIGLPGLLTGCSINQGEDSVAAAAAAPAAASDKASADIVATPLPSTAARVSIAPPQ
jgi:hypothetical protein